MAEPETDEELEAETDEQQFPLVGNSIEADSVLIIQPGALP